MEAGWGRSWKELRSHLSVEQEEHNNNSWCKRQQDVGPGSDKMGDDRKQLLAPLTAKEARSLARVFENLQMLLSSRPRALCRQHLKGCLSSFKHSPITRGLLSPLLSLVGNVGPILSQRQGREGLGTAPI